MGQDLMAPAGSDQFPGPSSRLRLACTQGRSTNGATGVEAGLSHCSSPSDFGICSGVSTGGPPALSQVLSLQGPPGWPVLPDTCAPGNQPEWGRGEGRNGCIWAEKGSHLPGQFLDPIACVWFLESPRLCESVSML